MGACGKLAKACILCVLGSLPQRAAGAAELGPVDIHLSHIMALTKNSIDTYDSAVFS
jgi:hypothetical protein